MHPEYTSKGMGEKMMKGWTRSGRTLLWFGLIVVMVLLLIISAMSDCRGEEPHMKWNPILERHEIREGLKTKAYLYRDRWLDIVRVKDAGTHEDLSVWKYNRWLERWEQPILPR